MISVNKEEAMAIREKFPDITVIITNRQSNHKKYYAPEEPKVLRFVGKLRAPGLQSKG